MPKNKDLPLPNYMTSMSKLAETEGCYPLRVYREVLFPIFAVTVLESRRSEEDYGQLELFVMRAVGKASIQSIQELHEFFGLDEKLFAEIVQTLKAMAHLVVTEGGQLQLTELGRESLVKERAIQEQLGKQVFYFDGFTCQPLPRYCYSIRFVQSGDLRENASALETKRGATQEEQSVWGLYHALFSFQGWNKAAPNELVYRVDRAEYNVPDEVTNLEAIEEPHVVYLPMHILEVQEPDGQTAIRVVTARSGKHDPFFAALISNQATILSSLRGDAEVEPQVIIEKFMTDQGYKIQDFRLEKTADDYWKVIIQKRAISGNGERKKGHGEFIEVHSYCARLWCASETIRADIAAFHIIEKLEKAAWRQEPDLKQITAIIKQKTEFYGSKNLSLAQLKRQAKKRYAERALSILKRVDTARPSNGSDAIKQRSAKWLSRTRQRPGLERRTTIRRKRSHRFRPRRPGSAE